MFADQSRVPAGSAGGEHNAIDATQLLRVEIQSTELRRGLVVVEPAAHRVGDCLRLLKNLLEHVMLVVTPIAFDGNLVERMNRRGQLSRVAMH